MKRRLSITLVCLLLVSMLAGCGAKEAANYAVTSPAAAPAAEKQAKTAWRCTICGYIYEGDPLPEDYICPLCKHGASDFEKVEI